MSHFGGFNLYALIFLLFSYILFTDGKCVYLIQQKYVFKLQKYIGTAKIGCLSAC
jgi:hypothetical protein